jgi:hypothetical protein
MFWVFVIQICPEGRWGKLLMQEMQYWKLEECAIGVLWTQKHHMTKVGVNVKIVFNVNKIFLLIGGMTGASLVSK